MKERKIWKTRILLFIAAAFILSETTINVNAEAVEVSPTPTLESISILETSKSARKIEEYWTAERMKNAIPMPNPEISEEEFQRLINTPQEEESKSQEESKSVESSFVGESKVIVDTAGVPTRANVNEFPFSSGGKFFFTKPGVGDYSCSAQFVGSRRVIMTAAHCLKNYETGKQYSNFLFRRAYNDGGGQPVGWECGALSADWIVGPNNPPNWPSDYGFLYASSDSDVGALGLKTNIPYSTWTAIGYPYNYGSNKYMYKVDGSKGTVSNGVVEMRDNPMRSGNSGGAWIGDLTTNPYPGANYAIGLNSFHREDPTSEFGPYFDNDTYFIFEFVKNHCRVPSPNK